MITQAHPISAPTVSIVTVCRNAAGTIGATLASVRAQTHSAIQHIVVDGASNDGTQHIVSDNLRSDGILLSEPDSGIYNAMNKGLALATGDIVAILNADDFYTHTGIISKIVNSFMTQQVDAVYGDLVYVNADFTKVTRNWKAGSFSPSKFYQGWMVPHPTFFVKREFYGGYCITS